MVNCMVHYTFTMYSPYNMASMLHRSSRLAVIQSRLYTYRYHMVSRTVTMVRLRHSEIVPNRLVPTLLKTRPEPQSSEIGLFGSL